MDFPPKFPETATNVGNETWLAWLMKKVCENVCSRPTCLFCRICWNDLDCSLFLATTTQLFFQSLSSHTFRSCLEILSTTKNLCDFWRSKLQQVSTYAFRSWDDVFAQKWNCSSPNNLCKWTESSPTLSTNICIEWNLYLFWCNQLATAFRLVMNVGGSSIAKNKMCDNQRYKG